MISVTQEEEGQRIDNYLVNFLKSVPKSRIYRLIRKGEVRVNKKRIDVFYRILKGDMIRIPPLFLKEKAKLAPPNKETLDELSKRILYEDDYFLIINKPSGMSVHAGSTVRIGVIEALRYLYPKLPHLELAHRLDSETSGCLVLAKKKKILREIHELLREGKMTKIYWALTKGVWSKTTCQVDLPLHKDYREGGKHVVSVHHMGKKAVTQFHVLKAFKHVSLVEATLLTGRTHQIRVHAQALGHPIVGDERYGDSKLNALAHRLGLNRMFLHAKSVDFTLPSLNQHIKVTAPLDDTLEAGMKAFELCKDETHEV